MKIQIADSIKREIAEKVVEQASPGYSKDAQGEWYVVDGSSVVYAQANRPWNPWHDDAQVVAVDDLVWYCGGAQDENASFEVESDDKDEFEAAVEFVLGYVPSEYDTADLPYEDA
jgi:hypothetical protein